MFFLFVTISEKILIQQLSLGRALASSCSDNCTAHVEIPVGPFALKRAEIQRSTNQTLNGHRRNAEANERNFLALSFLPLSGPNSRENSRAHQTGSHFEVESFLIRRGFPFLNMHFYPPSIMLFFFAKKFTLISQPPGIYGMKLFFFAKKRSLRKLRISC